MKDQTMEAIKIGEQFWAANNLDITHFTNGDELFHATNDLEWKKASENELPAWCYYANDAEYGNKYGKLYNWYAVNDRRGIAPEGFRIPTDDDFKQLNNLLGKEVGQLLKAKEGWQPYGLGNGIDQFGFNAKPGGANHFNYANNPRGAELLYSKDAEEKSWFWTSSNADESSNLWAYGYCLSCWDADLHRFTCNRHLGFSIRCIKQ